MIKWIFDETVVAKGIAAQKNLDVFRRLTFCKALTF